MFALLGEFLFWAVLSLINLGASILIYYSTKLENKQELESELSTRPISKVALCLPKSFTYLSVLIGIINTSGAVLRFQQIHFLEIPSIPWPAIFKFIPGIDTETRANELLKPIFKAEFLVALNDWTSLFMCLTFFAAGFFNFATVRQLRLRDRWVKEMLLPVPGVASRPRCPEVVDGEKDAEVWRGVAKDSPREQPNMDGFVDEEHGWSPAALAPLCARESGSTGVETI